MPGAGLMTPQLVSVLGVEGIELAFGISGEYQIAGRREHGSQQHIFVWNFPGELARHRIPRVHMAVGGTSWGEFYRKIAIVTSLPFFRRGVVRRDVLAQFIDGHINK